jgi:sugar O-acyltransferase (sialic acid O-acetyltransferase NeuD family)
MNQIILVGYSGHSYVVIESIFENHFQIYGYCDIKKAFNNPYNLNYIGFEGNDDFMGWKYDFPFFIGIGDNLRRQKIAAFIETKGKKIATIIDNSSNISNTAVLDTGTFVCKNVIINSLAKIGKNVILNSGCIIEHECILSDAVHIAPGAVLSGNVRVGERSFVGANSIIKQGVKIGKDVIIGAGTVVICDVPDGKKIVGNPGRFI